MSRLTLSALVAILSLGLSGNALAESPPTTPDMPKKIEACLDNLNYDKAIEIGQQRLREGDLANASECFAIAGKRYREEILNPEGDCLVCDAYQRVAVLLASSLAGLPQNSINPNSKTFEESAKKALEEGNRSLAIRLYELAALSLYLNLQPNLETNMTAKDAKFIVYIQSSRLMETTANLSKNNADILRLLRFGRDLAKVALGTNYCAASDYNAQAGGQPYPKCKEAKDLSESLDAQLKRL